jgi:hypothetical protein
VGNLGIIEPTASAELGPLGSGDVVTSSIEFAIPEMVGRSIAFAHRGAYSGSIPRVECAPAENAPDGGHKKDHGTDDPAQRGQDGFAPLPFPPDQSWRADASPKEEKSREWPGQRANDSARQPLSSQ